MLRLGRLADIRRANFGTPLIPVPPTFLHLQRVCGFHRLEGRSTPRPLDCPISW
jgi:hypothetical protein